jgi:hypothetical protein
MRLNVEMDERDEVVLRGLVEKTGLTKKQIVIGSLLFAEWAIDEVSRGQYITSQAKSNIPYSNTTTYRSDLIRPVEDKFPPKP